MEVSFQNIKRVLSKLTIMLLLAAVLLGIVVGALFSQTNGKTNDSPAQTTLFDEKEETFEEAVQRSNCIFEGTFLNSSSYKDYYELEFKVDNILKGSVDDARVVITCRNESPQISSSNAVSPENKYVKGEQYVLVTSRSSMVYYPKDRYVIIDDLFIPMGDLNRSEMFGEEIALKKEDIKASRASTRSASEDTHIISKFTASSDLSDIVTTSDAILKIKIGECLTASTIDGTETFACNVIDTYKGSANSNDIAVVFFAKQVSIGEEYIVIVNAVEPDSYVYTLSAAQNCVFSDKDTDEMYNLNTYLKTTDN